METRLRQNLVGGALSPADVRAIAKEASIYGFPIVDSYRILYAYFVDANLLWGRSPHLAEARSGFWKGERASEGRGCFERGTLNADRKANRKGAALFNSSPSWCESQKPAQKLEDSITIQQGRTTTGLEAPMLIARPISWPSP